jgi:hypothetical protein
MENLPRHSPSMVNAAVEHMEKPPISAEPPRRSRVAHSQTSEEDYDCEGVFPNGVRPLWDKSDWAIARNLYLSQVGLNSFPVWGELDFVSGTLDQDVKRHGPLASLDTGFYQTQVVGKGRGIRASRDIKKGELVYSGQFYAFFKDGRSYQTYMKALAARDVRLACDVELWSWFQDLGKENTGLRIVDLDIGAMGNFPSKGEQANVQCGPVLEQCGPVLDKDWNDEGLNNASVKYWQELSSKEAKAATLIGYTHEFLWDSDITVPIFSMSVDEIGGEEMNAIKILGMEYMFRDRNCKTSYFATRDIQKDEELVGDYGDFVSKTTRWDTWQY